MKNFVSQLGQNPLFLVEIGAKFTLYLCQQKAKCLGIFLSVSVPEIILIYYVINIIYYIIILLIIIKATVTNKKWNLRSLLPSSRLLPRLPSSRLLPRLFHRLLPFLLSYLLSSRLLSNLILLLFLLIILKWIVTAQKL